MTTYFGKLTIGATPVQLPTDFPLVNKIIVQHAPGNTGNFKVGGNASLTTDTTTPGITIAPAGAGANPDNSTPPGGAWSVESYADKNDIPVKQYFFHGTHSGDLLMYQIHVKV
jgi:hypothetical protein